MADSLEEQLTNVFLAGLNSEPALVPELGQALFAAMAEGIPLSPSSKNKYTKSEANYRNSTQDQETCGRCTYFNEPRCELVAGRIQAEDTCDYWKKK